MPNPLTLADQNVVKQTVLFSDFPMNFDLTPSGDLARITNLSSILNSVQNIVLTTVNERPYLPLIGSTVAFQEFENSNALEAQIMQSAIQLAIKQNEPRVSVISVVISSDDQNDYFASVTLYVINNPNQIVLPILIKRDR